MSTIQSSEQLLSTSARKRFSKPSGFGNAICGQSNFGAEDIGIIWEPFGAAVFGQASFGNYLLLSGIYQMHKCVAGKFPIRMKFYVPKNPQTATQQIGRVKFEDAVAAWQALTPEQKRVYYQKAYGKRMSGYNLFLREFMLS